MKKVLLLLILISTISFSVSFAQNKTASGKVTSISDGLPLPGVSVFVKGSPAIGTQTDAQGLFRLDVPAGATTLVIRYIGFKQKDVAITAGTINIQLEDDQTQLSEVVVVGYGEQKKASLTGSTSKLTAQVIKDLPVAGIDQALAGRLAGVQINQNSGTPGGGISVRIRGSSSISASNQPLYVIDGVPLSTGDFSQLGYGGQTVNALTDINPSDIESIDVLKDASAAAIYGSRAANGVVLITTKRGASQKTQISFNSYYGTQEFWKNPNFLNREQYLEVMTDALINDGELPVGSAGADFVDYYYGAPTGNQAFLADESINTDWIKEVTNAAPIQNYDLSLNGGDAKTKYFFSGTYLNQEGVVIGSQYQRISGRLNLDHNINDKLSFVSSLQINKALNNRIVSDNTLYGPFANSLAASPLWPVKINNQYTRPQFFYSSPVAEGIENDDETRNFRSLGNVTGKYKILSGWNLNATTGFDVLNIDERRYTPTNYPGSSATATNGSGTNAYTTVTGYLLQAFTDYTKTFNEKHNINAVFGSSFENTQNRSAFVTGIGFPGEKFRFVSSAATVNSGSNTLTQNSLISVFSRINYDYKSKYLLSINARTDGSSRFGDNNKFGIFPSISAGWRMSEESFLKDNTIISNLKLRGSYGIVGNQEIGNFSSRGLYSGSNYYDQAGIAPTQLPNPDLKWETTAQTDIGLDIGFLRNRVNVVLDYYYKDTKDLLFNRPIPTLNGFGIYTSNIGRVENKGFEVELSTVNFDGAGDKFKWTSSFNIAFNRNKVRELYQNQDVFYGFGGNSIVLREGQPIGTFYGLISDGVFSTTADVPAARAAQGIKAGDMNYRDINGDNIITDDDLTITGNAQPKFIGGFNNQFNFKGFDFNVFLQYSYGNDIWNASGNFTQGMLANFFDDNQSDVVLNRWRKEGDVTQTPRATTDVSSNRNNLSNSTRFIEDGSYLRFKNVALGYAVPAKVLNKAGVRTVRVYAQAQNLFTFTNYSGFDPEVNFAGASNTTLGVDFYTFPQVRTITFGINLGF